jgi:class 3 adenylate cyclase
VSRRSAVALVVLAAALAAAIAVPLLALGNDEPRLTKAQYSERVTAIYGGVGESFRRAGSLKTSAALAAMKSALARASGALAELRPPREAEPDHRVLVNSTRDYSAQVDLVRASVDFGDPVTIASHLREVTAPVAIRRALRDLAAKGYRIPVTVVVLG